MGKFVDLTGMQFGQLTVISRAQNARKNSRTSYVMWNCKCSCGNQTTVKANNLRSGNTKSCGCKNDITKIPKKQAKDLRGMRFGKLIAHKSFGSFDGHVFWLCSCDCGEQVKVSSDHLLSGDTQSCGCLKRQLAQQKYTKEIKGQRFGMLTVLGRAGYIEDRVAWLCRCDCGKSKIIEGVRLRAGNVISCGCRKKSKGQIQVQNFLRNNRTSYKTQYQFDDLRTNKGFCLRFDFAIFQSDKLVMLVQYNAYSITNRWLVSLENNNDR